MRAFHAGLLDLLSWLKRSLPRSTTGYMRLVGLAVAIADGLVLMVWVAMVGPKRIAHTGTYIGKLDHWIAATLTSTEAARESLFFWTFLSLQFLCTFTLALCLWLRTSPSLKRSAVTDALLIILQILAALANHSDPLILIAAQLAFFLPRREAVIWLVLQMLAYTVSRVPFMIDAASIKLACNVADFKHPPLVINVALNVGWSLTWQAFAFCGGYIAAAEQHSRIRLSGAHAELVATQQLLSEAIRASERVRIARDLHDAIGHHLTALNLHLELAVRQAGSSAVESMHASRRLAQRLLAEVRTVVSIERRDQTINLRRALETLCAGLPSRHIALLFDEDVEVRTPTLAHAIFCCVQEAIGNTARQSGGLQVVLRNQGDGVAISINEEGRGMRKIKEGESLRSLRERIGALGGRLEAGLPQAGRLRMEIWLPQAGGAQ